MFGSQPSCLKHVLCPGNAVLGKHTVGPRLPVADCLEGKHGGQFPWLVCESSRWSGMVISVGSCISASFMR